MRRQRARWALCTCRSLSRRRAVSEPAQQLIRAVHHSAQQHCTWRDADEIGAHLVDSIAIAVQRCTGMALRASVEPEKRVAMGAAAA